MATVTGLTAERMLEIEAASVVDGDIVDGHLILQKHDESTIDAGFVIGPPGPPGPIGSDVEVLMEQYVLDVGIPGQIRAGRELRLEDFEHFGLDAPTGLWNLSNFNDSSGNNRHLNEKGSVSQARGINGLDSTAALFFGQPTDALYIVDTGASDPFRVRTVSFGAWIRTSKSGGTAYQAVIGKRSSTAGQYGYWLRINPAATISFGISSTGSDALEITSLSKLCDDRWHFVVGTFDGNLQELYVDAVLEASQLRSALIFGSSAPLNIGAVGADASANGTEPNFGRIDEAFVTSEILTEDRIHNLYCARIPHTLAAMPTRVSLNVYSSCKGASLIPADFPFAPLRLYNFSAGSLGNEGSHGVAGVLENVGGAVSVAGVDGTKNNAFNFSGTQRLTGTDANLPDGLESVSYGCWVKTANASATMYIITWGTTNDSNDTRLYMVAGSLYFGSGTEEVAGPFIADGKWHFIAVVQENAATDGLKRKLYLDGRLVATSTGLQSVTLGNKFYIGMNLASSQNFSGQVDAVFVTDIPLTFDEITKLYIKTMVEHMPSPKNAGDHIMELLEDDILATFDTLDISNRVNLTVAP